MISIDFLSRTSGDKVPDCSDLTGMGVCGRARGPGGYHKEEKGVQVVITWALELDRGVPVLT